MEAQQSRASETLRRREIVRGPAAAAIRQKGQRPRPAAVYNPHVSQRRERANELPPANRSVETTSAMETKARRTRRGNYIRPENSRREAIRSLPNPQVERSAADVDRGTRRTLLASAQVEGLDRDEDRRDTHLPQVREEADRDPRRTLGQRIRGGDSTLRTTPSRSTHDYHQDRGAHNGGDPFARRAAAPPARPRKEPELRDLPAAPQDVARRVERGPAQPLRAPRSAAKHVVPTDRYLAESTTSAVHPASRPSGRLERQAVRREVEDAGWRRQMDRQSGDAGTTTVALPRRRSTTDRRQRRERAPLVRPETDRNGEVFAPAQLATPTRAQKKERPRTERLVKQNQVYVVEGDVKRADERRPSRDRTQVQLPRAPTWTVASRPPAYEDRATAPEDHTRQDQQRSRFGQEARLYQA